MEQNDTFILGDECKDVHPGKGDGEYVEYPEDYDLLKDIPNWRRMLLNTWQEEFTYEGKKYLTVEHALKSEYYKFIEYPELSEKISLDSGSDISKQSALIIKRARDEKYPSNNKYDQWMKIERFNIQNEIVATKFRTLKTPRRVLLLTLNADLRLGAYGVMKSMHHLRKTMRREFPDDIREVV